MSVTLGRIRLRLNPVFLPEGMTSGDLAREFIDWLGAFYLRQPVGWKSGWGDGLPGLAESVSKACGVDRHVAMGVDRFGASVTLFHPGATEAHDILLTDQGVEYGRAAP